MKYAQPSSCVLYIYSVDSTRSIEALLIQKNFIHTRDPILFFIVISSLVNERTVFNIYICCVTVYVLSVKVVYHNIHSKNSCRLRSVAISFYFLIISRIPGPAIQFNVRLRIRQKLEHYLEH